MSFSPLDLSAHLLLSDLTAPVSAVNADQSHRFALTGQDPEGHRRTTILWREVDLVDGKVVCRVVVTLDVTMNTATILTTRDAVVVAQAILAAAQ
jgi:hypothetical protein